MSACTVRMPQPDQAPVCVCVSMFVCAQVSVCVRVRASVCVAVAVRLASYVLNGRRVQASPRSQGW